MRIDVHQHLWTDPLVEALAARRELPFVRRERGLSVLYSAGERPYVLADDAPAGRAALVHSDGLDGAFVSLSSAIGVESLPPGEAAQLLDAWHDSALALEGPFGVWGAIALAEPDARDVDRALRRGCIGVSLPAGSLASAARLERLRPVLARLEALGAPLFVHPGPGPCGRSASPLPDPPLGEPLWWPALTRYVADMQAAWLALLTAGRVAHPRLGLVFAMLAGLAPLHAERLAARGGPELDLRDPLAFYDTSSYGPEAVSLIEAVAGSAQLLYGSDRPVVDPLEHGLAAQLDWDAVAQATRRAFGVPAVEGLR
jgi:predicted TIM-barrel fold metal-dependent hydrolase